MIRQWVALSDFLKGTIGGTMSRKNQLPDPFPVRQIAGRWEVLLVPEDLWLSCSSEDDARAIAAAPILEYESFEYARSGLSFADELDRTSSVLSRYRIGFGSRFFKHRADEVRRSAS